MPDQEWQRRCSDTENTHSWETWRAPFSVVPLYPLFREVPEMRVCSQGAHAIRFSVKSRPCVSTEMRDALEVATVFSKRDGPPTNPARPCREPLCLSSSTAGDCRTESHRGTDVKLHKKQNPDDGLPVCFRGQLLGSHTE